MKKAIIGKKIGMTQIFDENGKPHILPGQIRVVLADGCLRMCDGKMQFIEILEQVKLTDTAVSA